MHAHLSIVERHGLSRRDLQAMANEQTDATVDDMEFFETLAKNHCLLMPPWIYHIDNDGQLEQLTPVQYREDYMLDKPSILLALMEKLIPSRGCEPSGV